jgi:hypothetical protein
MSVLPQPRPVLRLHDRFQHLTRNLLRYRTLMALVVLGTAALLIRIYRLDAQSLWLDEGSSWRMAGQSWTILLGDLFRPNAAYPLYHLLLKGWMLLFGSSEQALRFPSALAGALAVPAMYGAAIELERLAGNTPRRPFSPFALSTALIVLVSPFAIWYSQEAKVYSLLLLFAACLTWAFLRALHRNTNRIWLIVGCIALIAVGIHRLAALLIIAGGWAWLLGRRRPNGVPLLAPLILVGTSIALVAAMVAGLGSDRAATGAYIPADPLTALGLTFSRFSLDRWPGDVPWWWLVPGGILLTLGITRLAGDLRGTRRSAAIVVLTLFITPLLLFVIQLSFTGIYEARYLIIVLPAWAFVLSYPIAGNRRPTLRREPIGYGLILLAFLSMALVALFQPRFGIFSGDPVKEQYREAIAELAQRVHPDDAIVLHPSYIEPLYAYYMARMSRDPAPAPIGFIDFWQGETAYGQREWDTERRRKLAGYTRSFLLIAPDHARTVDAPQPGDEYGLVGLFWQFSRDQRTWPCGIQRYQGVHLLCQEAPEAYVTGTEPQPATSTTAVFGNNLELLGYTLKPTHPDGPGIYRAGGNLPISFFWDVRSAPDADLSMFIHLCRDCSLPPLAADDSPPLQGYLPTSSWLPGKPARDDRAVALPADLEPGEYTVLIGWYRPDDPIAGRLPVQAPATLGNDRLLLTTVQIVAGAP